MPKLNAKISSISSDNKLEACLVKLEGIVSTPTIVRFREIMKEPAQMGRDLLVDMNAITYINSSGLGELVRIHDKLLQRGFHLVVVNISEDILQLVQMLGLVNVLYITDTAEEALEKLDNGQLDRIHTDDQLAGGKPMRKGGIFIPVSDLPKPKLPEAKILLGINNDTFFTRFLARYLAGDGSENVSLVRSYDEAKLAMEENPIDIAILDKTLPEFNSICTDIKTYPKKGLTSIISIYPEGEVAGNAVSFRVVEDETLYEPFEVKEMVARAVSEFHRCREESILFDRELHLEIPTRDNAIASANQLLEPLVAESGLDSESSSSFFYAVREAIDNARRHGNMSDPQKLIDVLFVLDKEKITVTVSDEGPGFDFNNVVNKAQNTSPIEQARARYSAGGYGGLGIGLMMRCCSKFDYVLPGNMVKLTKYI